MAARVSKAAARAADRSSAVGQSRSARFTVPVAKANPDRYSEFVNATAPDAPILSPALPAPGNLLVHAERADRHVDAPRSLSVGFAIAERVLFVTSNADTVALALQLAAVQSGATLVYSPLLARRDDAGRFAPLHNAGRLGEHARQHRARERGGEARQESDYCRSVDSRRCQSSYCTGSAWHCSVSHSINEKSVAQKTKKKKKKKNLESKDERRKRCDAAFSGSVHKLSDFSLG
jgi:hypothetical protein